MAGTIVLTDKERILLLEQEVENLKERVGKTEDQLAIYQASAVSLNKMVHDLHKAIIGDAYGNPGFVKRMEGLEGFQKWFEQKKWWTLGAFAVITTAIGFIAYIIDKVSSYAK